MNRQHYRIVFNRARGQLMVVAETACAQGPGGGRAGSARRRRQRALATSLLPLATAAWLALGAPGAVPVAQAQIVADAAAPANQRPTVLLDGANRPLVNIQTPSAAGVSRNTYSRFDVQAPGAVLNNARGSNPWLAAGEAKVILNEVRSSNPSYLGGAITVSGSRAQVVIANPSGIQVDGASFVNASRATLSTGTPVIGANGALSGLDVRQGTVTVTAKGLNVRGVSYTDILSRAASIAGRVDANATDELSITTGTQSVDYATGQLSARTGAGSKPTVAIDTAALGGMYAGKITLLATEAGTGVRNAGTWQADGTSGQLIVTAEGRLENSGSLSAGVTSLATVSGHIEHSGSLKGNQQLLVSAGGDLNQRGSITAGQLALGAGQNINLASGSKLTAQGQAQLRAEGRLAATGASLVSTAGDITALAAQGISLSGSTVTGRDVHLETGAPFQETAAAISLSGGQIKGTRQTTAIATGDVLLSSPGGKSLSSDGHVYLQAGKNLTVAAGTTASAGQHFTALAGEALTLQGTSGSTASNGSKVTLTAGGDLTLAGNSVQATGGLLTATGGLAMQARQGGLRLHALSNVERSAHERLQLSAGQDLSLSAYDSSVVAGGLSAAGQNVRILANGMVSLAHLHNTFSDGRTQAVGSVITARDELTVGSVHASLPVMIAATTFDAGQRASITAQGDVSLMATTDVSFNESGQAVFTKVRPAITAGHIDLKGSAVTVQDTDLTSRGNMGLHARKALTLRQVTAQVEGNLAATSATAGITSTASSLTAKELLSLSSLGAQSHTGATFDGGALSIYNHTGNLTLATTRAQTRATQSAATQALSGQLSVESGGGMTVDAATRFVVATDLSIVTGAGNISLNAKGAMPGLALTYDHLGKDRQGHDITLIARGGDVAVSTGYGTANARDITLVGQNVRVGGTDDGVHSSFGSVYGSIPGGVVGPAGDPVPGGDGAGGLMATRNLSITATTGNFELLGTRTLDETDPLSWNHKVNWAYLRSSMPGGSIDVRAAGDINITGGAIKSQGTVQLTAGGHIVALGLMAESYNAKTPPFQHWQSSFGTSIDGVTGVTLDALGGHLIFNDGLIRSSQGAVKLQALGDITLESAQNHSFQENTTRFIRETWYGKKKVKTTTEHHESLVASPVQVLGKEVELVAGQNLNAYATQFRSGGNLRIAVGGDANYYGVYNQVLYNSTSKTTSSFLGIKYSKEKDTFTRRELIGKPAVLISKNNLESYSGGDQLLQGTVAEFGGEMIFQPGWGPKAKADAQVRLEGLKNVVSESRTRESNYVVWQKQSGSGSTVETLVLPKFTGPTTPVFKGPVLAQIPAGDFKTQLQTLSQQPGMAYLGKLSTRTDVNWQPVKLVFDQWSYKQQGLTPAGAALLGVAVAVASGGAGADILASVTGSAPGTAAAAAANAAFISLSSQAAITLVNNGGDIGKTLRDLGKSDTVKAALTAALTAGVLDKIGALPDIKALNGANATMADKFTLSLINAGGRALTNTAINGGSLEQALTDAIVGGLVDTAHGEVASHIKILEGQYIAHKLAHALAGCIAGAAAQGSCKDGAIGGAVGEMVAQLMPPANGMFYTEAEKTRVLGLSKIVAGATSAYAGGNGQTAITTAETAVSNNAFFVPPLVYWLAAAAGSYVTGIGGGDPVEGVKTLGRGTDPLSKAVANGTQTAITLSMNAYPQETTATLNFLAAAGQAVDATLTYVDSATGKVVSTHWNNLPPGTRDALIGAGKVTSFVLSPVGVGQLKTLVAQAPQAAKNFAEASTRHALAKSGGLLDPLTGKPVLDLGSMSNPQKALAGDLFGTYTVQQIIPNGQKLARIPLIGETGIDDLYKVSRPDVDYVVIEYKFVGDYGKSGSSSLGNTVDGKQGSHSWITGSDRLERAVGSRADADAVRLAAKAGRLETYVVTTRSNGSTEIEVLDSLGKVKTFDNSKIKLPKLNLAGAKP